MIKHVKIETFKSATGPAETVIHQRVVIAEGVDTPDAIKTHIKGSGKISTLDSDELLIDGKVVTEGPVEIHGYTQVGYRVYLVKRQEESSSQKTKDALSAKLTEKYPAQVATFRAAHAKRQEFKTRLNNKFINE